MPSEDTVMFNVGGRIYPVRRSLLEAFPSTHLARSASDEWHKGDDPIYIDRDADRFSYCLDYMRDGTVHLPYTQSKNALLNDMEYYGFEGVDTSSIRVDLPAGDAVNCLKAIEDAFSNEISQAGAEIRQAERTFIEFVETTRLKVRHLGLALACIREYSSTKKTELDMTSYECNLPLGGECLQNLRKNEVDWNLLNGCLEKYKLQAKSGQENMYHMYIIILEPLVN